MNINIQKLDPQIELYRRTPNRIQVLSGMVIPLLLSLAFCNNHQRFQTGGAWIATEISI